MLQNMMRLVIISRHTVKYQTKLSNRFWVELKLPISKPRLTKPTITQKIIIKV
ncbi:hypothetical protein [Moraxella lacunata]|uniref:hypothetical protein n=1 Tax=Moraxella lacunata TaxID=477 RepID=UPI003EE0A6AB